MTAIAPETPNRDFGGIEPDQLVARKDSQYEPLFIGKGGSGQDASTDHSDGLSYATYETAARTTIDIEDFSDNFQDRDWERLRQWHRGNRANWDGYGMERHQSASEKFLALQKKRIADALCDAAGTNRGEKEIVKSHISELDFESFGQHRGIERVALGLIAAVVETRRPKFGAGFETASLHRQDQFRSLMEEFGLDYGQLETVKGKVHDQFDDQTLAW